MPLKPLANLYGPEMDFQPQEWVNFEEDQPIDIRPAVGAFQKRFMDRPSPSQPPMNQHEMGHSTSDMGHTIGPPLEMDTNAPNSFNRPNKSMKPSSL